MSNNMEKGEPVKFLVGLPIFLASLASLLWGVKIVSDLMISNIYYVGMIFFFVIIIVLLGTSADSEKIGDSKFICNLLVLNFIFSIPLSWFIGVIYLCGLVVLVDIFSWVYLIMVMIVLCILMVLLCRDMAEKAREI